MKHLLNQSLLKLSTNKIILSPFFLWLDQRIHLLFSKTQQHIDPRSHSRLRLQLCRTQLRREREIECVILKIESQKKPIFFIIALFCSSLIQANLLSDWTAQYRGATLFQKNNFKLADAEYTKLLTQHPYDPTANYNVGLCLFKQNQFEPALQSFQRAAKQAAPNSQLQEQALFNQGNTYVNLNKLDEAIASYENVLKINATNDAAQHNLALVKKMKDEQQQKDKDQKKNNDKNDKNNKDNKDDKDNASSQDSESNKDNDKESSQNKENKESQDSKKPQQEKNDAKDQAKQQQADKDREQREQETQDKKDQQQSTDKLEKSKEKEQQQEKQDKPLEKSSEQQDKDNSSEDTAENNQTQAELQDALAEQMQENPAQDKRFDPKSATLMQQMQELEDNIQKQLLKINVSKQGAPKHGQKNW